MAIHKLSVKDPDGIGEFLDEVRSAKRPPGLSDDEWDAVLEVRGDNPTPEVEWVEGFFEYSEYLEVEFDDVKKTATVIRKK